MFSAHFLWQVAVLVCQRTAAWKGFLEIRVRQAQILGELLLKICDPVGLPVRQSFQQREEPSLEIGYCHISSLFSSEQSAKALLDHVPIVLKWEEILLLDRSMH